ncbi:MAG: glycosyl transferase family 1 [Desulfovibrio sp.]|nr:glycosyl transferase family 1 [Desulfovibrio sp.]
MRNGKRFEKIYLAASVDVEEEGLFSGSYDCLNPKIANAPNLARLIPLLDQGLKPTLFCSHAALTDKTARATIDRLRKRGELEIGAHLHHWNTPPLASGSKAVVRRVPASEISDENFAKKLRFLLREAADFKGEKIASFRMGRWDLHPCRFPILAENGVLCDASVRPLHRGATPERGADHFFAPKTPFRVRAGEREIFEVPVTATPLHPDLERLPPFLRSGLKNWGLLTLLPVEHPLWLLKLTAKTSLARGNRVLSLAWHSSELMPGGSPRMRDEREVNNFIKKISAWVAWLEDNYNVIHTTMSGLRDALSSSVPLVSGDGTWREIAAP